MRRKAGVLLLALLLLSSLCFAGGQKEEARSDGPLYIGQTWIVRALDPTQGSNPWGLTSHGISEYVYMLNDKGELKSRFVKDLKQVDDLHWKAEMKGGVLFSDGSPVDAEALCASLNTVQEKNPLSNATAGKMSFQADGDLSFTITTAKPTHVMSSVLAEWTNVVFKENGSGEYLFTGPYQVEEYAPGAELKLSPNSYYPGSDKRDDITIKAFKDVSAMKLARESGEIDMAFTVTPQVAEMLKKSDGIVKSINAGYQYFSILNINGKLNDPDLREALNYGLSREDYIEALKGGSVANGMFAHYYSFAGDSKVVHDGEKANGLLDKAGWQLESDGFRYKDGEPLTFRIITYASRPDLMTIMQIMASQLKTMGIQVDTEIVENIATSLKEGRFDMALYAQHTAPTGNPAFFLNQFFGPDGASNYCNYSSPRVDALLAQLGELPFGEEMDKKAREIQSVIFEDLPVLYLVDPQWHIAVSDRMADYEPYSGDYYIINAQLGLK